MAQSRVKWWVLVLMSVLSTSARGGASQSPTQDPNHETRTPDVPGLTASTSLCRVSDDETYGTTKTNPVKVGGGALYLASREVKYLSALRGPAGQGGHFKRNGSLPGDDGTILDLYTIEYATGSPGKIYLDGYHWGPPIAPKGWLCGADMNLNPPGPDAFETHNQLVLLAVQLSDQLVDPISMDPDGSRTHGVVFDHVRLIGLAARSAAAAGKPLDPKMLPRDVAQPHMVVVAFPLSCEGNTIAPQSVTISDANGNQPPAITKATFDKIADLLPKFTAPPSSIAVSYATAGLIDGAKATVHYEKACGTESADVVLPVKSERGRATKSTAGIAPPDSVIPPAGVQVRVQVFLAPDGTPYFPTYVSGPWELADAANAAAKEWRIEPPRMNGAPLLQTSTVAIGFRPR